MCQVSKISKLDIQNPELTKKELLKSIKIGAKSSLTIIGSINVSVLFGHVLHIMPLL